MILSDFFVKVIDVFGKETFMKIFFKSRSKKVVYARCIVSHYLNTELKYTHKRIAEYLNHPHSSITTWLIAYKNWYKYDKQFRELVDNIFEE